MSDLPQNDGIPAELQPWVDERREELGRIFREQGPEAGEIRRAQLVDELHALLEQHEAAKEQQSGEHQVQMSLVIDESKVRIIRAGEPMPED